MPHVLIPKIPAAGPVSAPKRKSYIFLQLWCGWPEMSLRPLLVLKLARKSTQTDDLSAHTRIYTNQLRWKSLCNTRHFRDKTGITWSVINGFIISGFIQIWPFSTQLHMPDDLGWVCCVTTQGRIWMIDCSWLSGQIGVVLSMWTQVFKQFRSRHITH